MACKKSTKYSYWTNNHNISDKLIIKDLYINQINLKKITTNQTITNTNNKIVKVNNKNM
jgi:hypothetical protein